MRINEASDRLQVALMVTQLHAMAERRAAHHAGKAVSAHMLDLLDELNDAAVIAADAVEIEGAASPAPIH